MLNNHRYLLIGFKHHKIRNRIEMQLLEKSDKPFPADEIKWYCDNLDYFDYFKVYVEKMRYGKTLRIKNDSNV